MLFINANDSKLDKFSCNFHQNKNKDPYQKQFKDDKYI